MVLVGDPKQLDPTIQSGDVTHDCGLEQTLFDRLVKMVAVVVYKNSASFNLNVEFMFRCFQGHEPVVLRTQYRCHPTISAIPNQLFYDGQLIDGVTEADRPPLVVRLSLFPKYYYKHDMCSKWL